MHHSHSADCSCQHPHASSDPSAKQTPLTIALILILSFAGIEFVVGHLSHSLVLVAESGHMMSDGLALALALLATWVAQLPDAKWGLLSHRHLETWAALVNSFALGAIAIWIGWEAIQRLQMPLEDIASLPLLITATVGFVVNSINIALLHGGSDQDLNLRAAFLHVVADALSSIGVIVAAIAVAGFHWLWADGAISLLVAGLILTSVSPLILQGFKRLLPKRVHPMAEPMVE